MTELQKLTPHDWQEVDIQKIVKSTSPAAGALVVSAPGAGKTLVAVEAIIRLQPKTVLIVAPPSTHWSAWHRTLLRQGVDLPFYRLVGSKAKEYMAKLMWGEPGVYITSAQWFTRQKWGGIVPDMAIIDEIHMLGKYGNKGMKALCGFSRTKGLYSPVRIGLSGTPWRNSFENAWSIVKWIEPSKVNSEFWVWRRSACDGQWNNFAPQNFLVTGEKNPGKLASSLTCFISHSQRLNCCEFHPEGFLAGLAEPIRIERDLEMTPKQGLFYRGMEKSYFGWLTSPGDNGRVPVVAELPIVARGMLRFCALALPSLDQEQNKLFFRDETESPKIEQLLHDLGGMDGKRVLILTHSKQFADLVQKRVTEAGYNIAAWTGGLTQKRRDAILDGFLSGELDAIVGVIAAMGTGTDGLQEAAYNLVFMSVDDDSSNNTQGVARLDRLGQKHQVVIAEYRMLNTFDVGHLGRQLQRQLDLNRTLQSFKVVEE